MPCADCHAPSQADKDLAARGQKVGKLEEASRLLQKCFSVCLNDR